MEDIIRSSIFKYLKGIKSKSTEEYLGYSFEIFNNHIEDERLLFELYGIKYHLDHKIPVSWFKEDTSPSIIWHLENLWLVTEEYNHIKYNLWSDEISIEYKKIILPYLREEYITKVK